MGPFRIAPWNSFFYLGAKRANFFLQKGVPKAERLIYIYFYKDIVASVRPSERQITFFQILSPPKRLEIST